MPYKKKLIRIDDFGASSKLYEWHSGNNFTDIGGLKHRKFFGKMGPYKEIQNSVLREAINWFNDKGIIPLLGVTACWRNRDGKLIRYDHKFPKRSENLKSLVSEKKVEIGCHGLTHCQEWSPNVLPNFWKGNREQHREFTDSRIPESHYKNLQSSKAILEDIFQTPCDVFIPPGNHFTVSTLEAAAEIGFKVLSCNTVEYEYKGLKLLPDREVLALHDLDLIFQFKQVQNKIEAIKTDGYTFTKFSELY